MKDEVNANATEHGNGAAGRGADEVGRILYGAAAGGAVTDGGRIGNNEVGTAAGSLASSPEARKMLKDFSVAGGDGNGSQMHEVLPGGKMTDDPRNEIVAQALVNAASTSEESAASLAKLTARNYGNDLEGLRSVVDMAGVLLAKRGSDHTFAINYENGQTTLSYQRNSNLK